MKKLLTTILSVFMMVSLVGVNVFAYTPEETTYTTVVKGESKKADVDELDFDNSTATIETGAAVYYDTTKEITVTIKNDTDTDYGYVAYIAGTATSYVEGTYYPYAVGSDIKLSNDYIAISAGDLQKVTYGEGSAKNNIVKVEPNKVVKAGDTVTFTVTVKAAVSNAQIQVLRFGVEYEEDETTFKDFKVYDPNITGTDSKKVDGTIWYVAVAAPEISNLSSNKGTTVTKAVPDTKYYMWNGTTLVATFYYEYNSKTNESTWYTDNKLFAKTTDNVKSIANYYVTVNGGDIKGNLPTVKTGLTFTGKAQQLIASAGSVEAVDTTGEVGKMFYLSSGSELEDDDLAYLWTVEKNPKKVTTYANNTFYTDAEGKGNYWYKDSYDDWWTTDVTKITAVDAGDYNVYYAVLNPVANNFRTYGADVNVEDLDETYSKTVTIGKTSFTVTAVEDLTLVSTGTTPVVEVNGVKTSDAWGNTKAGYDDVALDYTIYAPDGTVVKYLSAVPTLDDLKVGSYGAGNYTIMYASSDANYKGNGSVTVTINKYGRRIEPKVNFVLVDDTTYYGYEAFNAALNTTKLTKTNFYKLYKDVAFDELTTADIAYLNGLIESDCDVKFDEDLYNALLVSADSLGSHTFTLTMMNDNYKLASWYTVDKYGDETVLSTQSVTVTWTVTNEDTNPIVVYTNNVKDGVEAQSYGYNGSYITPIYLSSNHGEITYSKTVDGEYTSTMPSFKEVGTHTVYYKVESTGHVTVKGSFTVTIHTGWIKVTPWYKDGSNNVVYTTYDDAEPMNYYSSSWYYMNSDLSYKTGWFKSAAGKWYYFSTGKDGVSTKGLMVTYAYVELLGNGKYYVVDSSTALSNLENGLATKVYYLTSDGWMVTGWYGYGYDEWIYAKADGSLLEDGWVKSASGKWYYVENFWMVADETKKIDGVTYYFNVQGAMVTGWYKESYYGYSYWIYCDANGAAHTGWVKSGAKWYYVEDGMMATNTWIGNYWVDASGAWVPSETM